MSGPRASRRRLNYTVAADQDAGGPGRRVVGEGEPGAQTGLRETPRPAGVPLGGSERRPGNPKAAGSIPSQSVCGRHPISVCVVFSLSLPLPFFLETMAMSSGEDLNKK